MPNTHTFTADDLITEPLTPPAGATGVTIRARFARNGGADNCRLMHLRLQHPQSHPQVGADHALPRETEIVEVICRNGVLTAGFSGAGAKRAQHQVIHMGNSPAEFDLAFTVPFSGKGVVVAAGSLVATSDTDIAPSGRPLELLLGFKGPGDLGAPVGWTATWDDKAVEWLGGLGASLPPQNIPPSAQPVGINPPVIPAGPGKPGLLAVLQAALLIYGSHLTPEQSAALQLLAAEIGK